MRKYRTALENKIDRLFHYQPYRSDFVENTIRNGIVRFARASEFNDPWDCKPSFFVPHDNAELRRLVKFMCNASERHTPEVSKEYRAARVEEYLANPERLRADLAASSEETWAQMDRRYRLYCLSTKPDCALMWGHYADHHRGVCLEFNVQTPDFSSALQVDYSADYPRFYLDADNDLSPFHSKSIAWSYEEEYRLIAQETGEALGSGTLMTRDNGMCQLSKGALVSIIIGACATETATREITALALASGLLVRRATRLPHRYELTIEPSIATK